MKIRVLRGTWLFILLWAMGGCTELEEFSGVYEGEVEAFEAIRAGFGVGTTMSLDIRFASVWAVEGTLTTSDGRFMQTSLKTIDRLANDLLAAFDFEGGGLVNVLCLAPVSGDASDHDALIVLSALDKDRIDVRVVLGVQTLYGVFRLKRR